MGRETYLTLEGRQELEKELEYLRTVRRREVAKRIHESREAGGTASNAEYEEAKNEQAFVEGRIFDIERILDSAVVVAAGEHSRETVEFGSSVDVVAEDGGKRHYRVVGSAEANPLEGKISHESPVGRALMGRKVGDKVDVQTPKGSVILTIIKID